MGDELYTVVDFGPGWFDPSSAFAAQAAMNAPGKSPPFCSEFYTGWLTHWGEAMANTSSEVLFKDTQVLLEWANSTASLSFYMIHGGTNFGFWAGANVDGERYLPHITSYDYDAPISEAGDYCQPGIGGDCKYYVLRDLIAKHTGRSLPEPPPRPAIRSYGKVDVKESLPLMEAVPALFSGGGIRAEVPDIMEEYGQRWGLILYRTRLPAKALEKDGALDLGGAPHDYATVFVDGELAGRLDRSEPATNLTLRARHAQGKGKGNQIQLDILVEAMGRQNFGCDTGNWDWKGLTSQNVTLNGKRLRGWEVFPLQLDDVSDLAYASGQSGAALVSAARRRMLEVPAVGGKRNADAPAFFRGTFEVDAATAVRGPSGHLADTYLALHGWSKGIAWVNGFNLGWYWPRLGPQMTLYVPGPVLREGANEVVLLEVERAAHDEAVLLDDKPDFWGPGGSSAAVAGAMPPARRRVP
jgi:beta-galactosidase